MSTTTTTTPHDPLPILIIGTGLGGLLLAQGLRRANIPFRLFERDASFSTRLQGYRIRISGEGIAALESALPAPLFERFERTCAHVKLGGTTLVAQTAEEKAVAAFGGPRAQHPTGGDERANGAGAPSPRRRPYTPDRATLRGVLMEGLEGCVAFGKEFVGYDVVDAATTTDEERGQEEEGVVVVVARFADGSSARGRLLVGADGARSRVRRQYLGAALRPVDTSGRVVYGKTPLTDGLRARMGDGVLDVMTLAEDKSRGEDRPVTCLWEPIKFPQRGEVEGLPEDYVYWVLVARKETLGVTDEELVGMTSERAGDVVSELTKEWHPRLRALFESADPNQTAALRVLSMRPEMAAWEALKEPVTLIGDAAHCMPPTGGVGAVTAFRDAANLAKILAENSGCISADAVGKYEEMMREYAAESINSSRQGGVRFFNHPPFSECKEVDV